MATGGGTLSVNNQGYSTGSTTYGWIAPRDTTYHHYYNYPYWTSNKPNLKPCIQHILDNKDLKDKEKILLIEALLKAV